jgi:hypothetical protein
MPSSGKIYIDFTTNQGAAALTNSLLQYVVRFTTRDLNFVGRKVYILMLEMCLTAGSFWYYPQPFGYTNFHSLAVNQEADSSSLSSDEC